MSEVSKFSKMQIRAQVLQLVLPFKNSDAIPNDVVIENCINDLIALENTDFVTSLLLKELSGSSSTYDNVLTLILYNVSNPEILTKNILEMLADKSVLDVKKLFLIGMLRDCGNNIDYNFIESCVNNPDEAIDAETKKFLQEAVISPETQIDFFDFYFTVNASDRQMLVESIIADYSGDDVANILSPFAYFYPEICIDEKIINALAQSKSYFAYPALKWCSEKCPDNSLALLAKKQLNKLDFSGTDIKKTKSEIYSKMLSDSVPYGFWYSIADGNSNISCVFARKRNDGSIQTFFTVFNLEYGPVCTFGFNEILKQDFDMVLLRFFKSSLHAKVPVFEGKVIFDYLTSRGWQNSRKIPYEFVCWMPLTYDIDTSSNFNDLISLDYDKKIPNKNIVYQILNSEIFSSWFFEYGDLELFDNVVNVIEKENILDIAKIDSLILDSTKSLLSDCDFKEKFIEKIKFQSYILKNSNMESTSRSLYSCVASDEYLQMLLVHILKRSLYENYLKKVHLSDVSEKRTIFTKNNAKYNLDFANAMIRLIEEQWT